MELQTDCRRLLEGCNPKRRRRRRRHKRTEAENELQSGNWLRRDSTSINCALFGTMIGTVAGSSVANCFSKLNCQSRKTSDLKGNQLGTSNRKVIEAQEMPQTQETRSSKSRNRTTMPLSLISLGLFLLTNLQLVHCQQQSNPNSNNNNNLDLLLQNEARAEINRLQGNRGQQPAASLDLNQLVSLFNSIQSQQRQRQQTVGGNNVQPLPLGAMGGQRGAAHSGPQQLQPQHSNQLGQNAAPSSTQANPFAAASNFQSTRRQQSPLFGPAALPGPSFPMLSRNNNLRPQLAGPPNNNNNNNQPNSARPQMARPPPAQPTSVSPSRTPLVPPPARAAPNQLRPLSGFAPSGPPPNLASNSAINVVQSPSNAIGLQPVQSSSAASTTVTSTATASSTSPEGQSTLRTTSSPSSSSTASPTSHQATSSEPTVSEASSSFSETSTQISSSHADTHPQETTSSSSSSSTAATTLEQQQKQQPSSTDAPNLQWNPVESANSSAVQRSSSTTLAPSPDIVTVPPGYNPNSNQNAPQTYEIPVSAQMGGRAGAGSNQVQQQQQAGSGISVASVAPTAVTTIFWSPPSNQPETGAGSGTGAGSSVSSSLAQSSATVRHAHNSAALIQPTRVPDQPVPSSTRVPATVAPTSTPTLSPTLSSISSSTGHTPTRIRDSSALSNSAEEPSAAASVPAGVVYGKAPAEAAKPTGPPGAPPQPSSNQDQLASGRPFIQSAPLDSQVRPFTSSARQHQQHQQHSHSQTPFRASKPLGSTSGSGSVVGSAFSIVASGNQTMPTGDIQDYVAGKPPPIVSSGGGGSTHEQDRELEPTVSGQGGPDPFDLLGPEVGGSSSGGGASLEGGVSGGGQTSGSGSSSSSTQAPVAQAKVRRPSFKPKPAVPPIRIDSCIVGDDSSCDQTHNERCVTEYGISSCHCRPGFARLSQLRGFCSPVVSLQFSMKIDKLADDRRLVFNHTLENPNSEEYQYLEFETLQAVASAMQQSSLGRQFMGARVNKFLERKGRIWANVSVNLELNEVTKNEQAIQKLMGQELTRLQRNRQPLGDSTVVLDAAYKESASVSPSAAFSKLQDVNECSNKELNDCSKHATCTNEFGGFSCQCLPGFEDKYQTQMLAEQAAGNSSSAQMSKSKLGRICMGCSASYCSNRGECSIVDGKKQCKCKANFMGSRCDIDSEVLAVAIGGSLVGLVILVVTFWCLFVFNRRWRREQQKMDAMSATSGLTNYNYASNSANSSNTLMAPTLMQQQQVTAGRSMRGARSTGGVAAAAANYVGQRFVGGLMGRSAGGAGVHHGGQQHHLHHHYALEQQAILAGSGASSGSSSAASQPLACNPYHQGYAYDEGLLIAPISSGSSEQTSPSGNSYRGIISSGATNTNHSAALMAAGNAYTLSGHHHHNHHQHQHQQQQLYHQLNQLSHHNSNKSYSQFHPMEQAHQYNPRAVTNGTQNAYDLRWRTMQGAQHEASAKSNGTIAGYYLVR